MEYIKTVLLTAVLVCLATALAPASAKLRRGVTLAASALFLSVLLTPAGLGELWESFTFPLAESQQAQSPEMLEAAFKEGIEKGIRKDLISRFSLDDSSLWVDVISAEKEGERVIEKVTLRLGGNNIFADYTGMIRYMEKAYGGEIEVTVFE